MSGSIREAKKARFVAKLGPMVRFREAVKQGSLPNSAQCCVSLVAPQREQRSVVGPCSALGHGSAQDGHMGYHLGHVITSRRLISARVHLQLIPDRMLWRFQRPHHVSDRGVMIYAVKVWLMLIG